MTLHIASLPDASPTERLQPAPAPERSAEFERALVGQMDRSHPASGALAPPTWVRPHATKLSGEQAARALERAWSDRQGRSPSKATLAILTAHWAHETGRGEKMLNFNFAGIKGTGPGGLSAACRTREGWGDSERAIVDRFRAYSTAAEGAADYLSLLERRYPAAVDAARAEDPASFVRELKQGGYFTGDERAYVKNVTRLANHAMAHGFDSVGQTGSVTPLALEIEPYFGVSASARVDAPAPVLSASYISQPPLSAPPVSVVESLWDVHWVANELSRAATRIAADESDDTSAIERGFF